MPEFKDDGWRPTEPPIWEQSSLNGTFRIYERPSAGETSMELFLDARPIARDNSFELLIEAIALGNFDDLAGLSTSEVGSTPSAL